MRGVIFDRRMLLDDEGTPEMGRWHFLGASWWVLFPSALPRGSNENRQEK
jgi:hypothetical protein